MTPREEALRDATQAVTQAMARLRYAEIQLDDCDETPLAREAEKLRTELAGYQHRLAAKYGAVVGERERKTVLGDVEQVDVFGTAEGSEAERSQADVFPLRGRQAR